jgi:hypothetical protein
MANDEHLAILQQGVEVWNAWREEHPNVEADLRKANLEGANLQGANLEEADLRRAYLHGAYLHGADLSWADLSWADLSWAILYGADLTRANLEGANLSGADLTRANLEGAYLQGAKLDETNMREAWIGWTVFVALDLRDVQGLDTVEHVGPSSIGIDTLYRSQGDIPEAFLRGCGVPDSMIEYAHALVAAERPIDYYSAFISYSSKDEALAKRLHADLQAAGVRCWYAPHDLPIGARIRVGIDEAIRLHDKLLLLLSKHSVASDWVEKEVETAMEQERRQKRTVLFPIRLDTAVMRVESGWPADVRRGRNIGDFCKWKQHNRYQEAFTRLLRDLKAKDRGELGE